MADKKRATKRKAAPKRPAVRRVRAKAAAGLPLLEKNILISKGLTDAQIRVLARKGIRGREDLRRVGDAETLAALADLPRDAAERVMSWALGVPISAGAGSIIVDSGDIVYCVHCKTKQPKDYKSGDLCVSCGKQAEPILACFWCASTGPGKHCRQCGAEFVPVGEFELAVLLKREGLPKLEIPEKLRAMSQGDKDALWGRVRRY